MITRLKASTMKQDLPKYRSIQAGIPFIPAIGTATDLGTGSTVSVAFTGNNTGSITYTAISNPGNITATGSSSPITVSGLTAGTAYTFRVNASNGTDTSAYSAASNSVTPAVPTSYESIATASGNGSSGTITFSSIPSTYKHLQLRWVARSGNAADAAEAVRIQFNSDTGANYAYHRLVGDGSAAASAGFSSASFINVSSAMRGDSSTSNVVGACIVDIHDYSVTTKNKTVRAFAGADDNDTTGAIAMTSGLWMNTAAISTITLTTNASSFGTLTSVALYGIRG